MSTSNDPFDRGISLFRGTRDWSGVEAKNRLAVIEIISKIYESFGFEPLVTPAIENERTLAGKYGEEGEMKRFKLNLSFPQEAGLRYDQTVPLARFMALNWNKFPLPYRRYAIGQVWRNESPAAGRLREFTQCDFDTVGSSELIVDAEIVAINYTVLDKLGFGNKYVIQINDRRLLDVITQTFLEVDDPNKLYRAWDNIEKKNWVAILEELRNPVDEENNPLAGLEENVVQKIDDLTSLILSLKGTTNDNRIKILKENFIDSEEVTNALNQISELIDLIRAYGVPEEKFSFNPLLARGLDYYTGPIFETIVTQQGVGSISGGGRFDKLISSLGGPNLPASGSSFGLERVIEVMERLNIPFPSQKKLSVYVTVFSPEYLKESLVLASKLRVDVNVELFYNTPKKLGKQIDIARRKGYKFVLIIGPDEVSNKSVQIKNLETGEQVTIPQDSVLEFLQSAN